MVVGWLAGWLADVWPADALRGGHATPPSQASPPQHTHTHLQAHDLVLPQRGAVGRLQQLWLLHHLLRVAAGRAHGGAGRGPGAGLGGGTGGSNKEPAPARATPPGCRNDPCTHPRTCAPGHSTDSAHPPQPPPASARWRRPPPPLPHAPPPAPPPRSGPAGRRRRVQWSGGSAWHLRNPRIPHACASQALPWT